ncbi:two-component system regulatory protein YycI [Marinicrinis lubricantis]|uniref:Two-component system regulatory protein YycI n=1 Tax=Marinicrinis lubricantis TaxID=2086470 RepID=A0ABW1IQN0_9BACL
MEWGRAKTILILAFLGLNLVLGYQLWFIKKDVFGSKMNSSEMTQQTLELLEDKGITVKQDIPKDTPKAGEIVVRFESKPGKYGDGMYRLSLEDAVLLEDYSKGLSGQIDYLEQYKWDPVLSKEGVNVLNQLYNELPLFEVNLKLYYTDGIVYAYEQKYAKALPSDTSKEQTVLSAYTALQLLAEKYLPNGTVIEDIRLGYHGKIYNSDTQVMAPKWRFSLQNGTVYYMHAINGEVEEVQKE